MSSACRSADGGLEVMSQNTDDVLFLTPNNDQDEDESCDPEDQRANSPGEASVHNAYAAQAQISLLVDADDLNEDLESVERHDRPADDYVRNEKVEADDTVAVDEGDPADKADNGDTETRPQVDESVIAEMKYLFKNTRYFLIKSNNFENVALAQKKGVWSTPRVNEIKLNKAYRVIFRQERDSFNLKNRLFFLIQGVCECSADILGGGEWPLPGLRKTFE